MIWLCLQSGDLQGAEGRVPQATSPAATGGGAAVGGATDACVGRSARGQGAGRPGPPQSGSQTTGPSQSQPASTALQNSGIVGSRSEPHVCQVNQSRITSRFKLHCTILYFMKPCLCGFFYCTCKILQPTHYSIISLMLQNQHQLDLKPINHVRDLLNRI